MVAILGYGISGKTIHKYLLNKGYEVLVIDDRYKDETIEIKTSKEVVNSNLKFEFIVKSPGIFYNNEVLLKYNDTLVTNDIELFYQEVKDTKIKIIAITATNGKTSTVTLLNNTLNRAGFKSNVAGNIGISPLEYIINDIELDYIVLELSSFQLKQIDEFRTYAAIFINFTPDHLDYHGSLKEYFACKLNIVKNTPTSNRLYLGETIYYTNDKLDIIKPLELAIDYSKIDMGIHPENLMLINAFLFDEGIDNKYLVEELLEGYKGIEHRVEFVENINGVSFYNDSKATNLSSTVFALSRLNNIILLVGGYDKGEDLSKIQYHLQNVKYLISYGQNRDTFKFIDNNKSFKTLEEAFKYACLVCEIGDNILLSPASASYDQFKNFEHRGEHFKNLVKEYRDEIYN